jgi:hypothetical protein
MSRDVVIVVAIVGVAGGTARAELTTVFDYEQWQSMSGRYTTIDFTGYPNGTPISTQYRDLGVVVTGPAFIAATNAFQNDGWGLHGPSGLRLHFGDPQFWIAIHHAGVAMFELYYQGELIGISSVDPVGGIGSFVGVRSWSPFDEVIITNPPLYGPHVFVDDLHWGTLAIPAPPCLLIFSGLVRRRRRA